MLEYVPSSFKVIRHVRPKLSCRVLRDDRAGADAVAADRTRPARSRPARACAGVEVLRPYAAAPPGRHLCPRRRRTRSLDAGRLGRPGGVPAGSPGRGDRPACPRRAGAACRRHHRPGAGARYWERPRPDGCGSSCATSGPSARMCHRRPFIATRRTARASTRRRCSAAAAASFMPMAMPGSTGSTGPPRRTASRR